MRYILLDIFIHLGNKLRYSFITLFVSSDRVSVSSEVSQYGIFLSFTVDMKEVDLLCSTSRLVKHSAGNHNLNIENLQLTLVHPIYETSEKFYDFIG